MGMLLVFDVDWLDDSSDDLDADASGVQVSVVVLHLTS
jgi:hypothetical protein